MTEPALATCSKLAAAHWSDSNFVTQPKRLGLGARVCSRAPCSVLCFQKKRPCRPGASLGNADDGGGDALDRRQELLALSGGDAALLDACASAKWGTT